MGEKIAEVPISYAPRSAGEGKKIRHSDGWLAIWTLLRYRFSRSARWAKGSHGGSQTAIAVSSEFRSPAAGMTSSTVCSRGSFLLIHFRSMEKPSLPPIPRSVFWLVLWSFVLQVAMIGVFREYRTRPQEDHFAFGWEMGRVARSVALGQGFSNPYGGNTGPTAWEPPLYPYLMAGVFKLFGIYTYASAWVLLMINSLFAALTTIPIFLIARRTFGERVARLVGMGMGAQSLHMVLVDSLDLGHDVYAARSESDFSGGSGTAGVERLTRLGDIRVPVGRGCVGESVDARVPAVLWALDMAAAIQERAAFVRWHRAVVRDFLSCALAVAGPEL